MEIIVLSLFCCCLVCCIVLKLSILWALLAGLLLFCGFSLHRGFPVSATARMCWSGVLTSKNIMLTMLIIGVLTASWRASGTIAVIVSFAQTLIVPSLFLLIAFLLNCGVSFLTGSAFATAATMGVICATMSNAMGISPIFIGGVILSGVYFGDRCSPISTSALLVAQLSRTDLFDNMRLMMRNALVPFALTCLLYACIGIFTPHRQTDLDLAALFGQEFTLHWLTLIPAILILLLAFLRINVKTTMIISILCAIVICLLLQHMPLASLLYTLIFGYTANHAEVAAMMNGGGMISMLRVVAVISLSSAYAGIFHETGLLAPLQDRITHLYGKIGQFATVCTTAIITSTVACNQTLSIILTHQLNEESAADHQSLAIDIEDSAVVIAALIPWSTAGVVPLDAAGAPTASVLLAAYLYLIPLWRLITSKPS